MALAALVTASGSETSHYIANTFFPNYFNSSSTFFAASRFKSAIVILQPLLANIKAIYLPIPIPPPVINTCLP